MKGFSASGFTLIELLAVLLLVTALAIGIGSRFSGPANFKALTARDDIVAGLFYAQQVALARQSATNSVQFVSDGVSIDVREAGVSIGNGIYPLALPSGFLLTAVTLDYDKLGRTSSVTLTLAGDGSGATINVAASGYAN